MNVDRLRDPLCTTSAGQRHNMRTSVYWDRVLALVSLQWMLPSGNHHVNVFRNAMATISLPITIPLAMYAFLERRQQLPLNS